MSDLIVRSASRAQVAQYAASQRLVAYAHGLVERLRREQTGQDMVEYAGVLIVVAAIVLAVYGAAGGIGSSIVSGVTQEIGKIFSGH